MKNADYCKYTYAHRKMVEFLIKKYVKDEATLKVMLDRARDHDLDKMTSYLFYNHEAAHDTHVANTSHHDNKIKKNRYDYIEMVMDWESARYTKPDKPLNAYDTLYKYYPHLEEYILPILAEYGIDKSNLPAEEDAAEYAKKVLSDITEADIMEEILSYINRI